METALREYHIISLIIGLVMAATAGLCVLQSRKIIAKLSLDIMADPATVESERRVARRTVSLLILVTLGIFLAISSAVRFNDARLWMGIFDPQHLIVLDELGK